MGEVEFDEYAASEPDGATEQPMSDQDIVDLVRTENDPQEEEEEEEESVDEQAPSARGGVRLWLPSEHVLLAPRNK